MTTTTDITDDTTTPAHASTDVDTVTFLTADEILNADDRKPATVDVPEWGGKVLVMGLSGTERDAYIGSLRMLDPRTKEYVPNNTNSTAKLVSRCIVNPAGEPLFSNAQVAALGRKNGGALQRVSDVAERLSGLGQQAEKDAEGNSDTTPSDGSTSSEPSPPASQ